MAALFLDPLSCFIFIPFLSLPDNTDEMNKFELTSAYRPTGDQPEAIAQLTEGVLEGVPAQILLGVTGSGKTFTIANVIANINKPTLILSHNKTLAAQLYSEFKGFFPNNAVEYYVSYYDYYQPEAYLPSSDTYIEKDLAINDEIDKLRLAATSALLSGRKDVVVVSSVSCIYGMGNPADFYNNVIEVQQGKTYSRNVFLRRLVDSLYVRNDIDLNRGNFRVKGDTVDIYLAYADNLLRIVFWGDEVDSIEEVDPVSGVTIARFDAYKIYPANLFMTTKEATLRAIHEIEDDLHKQVQWFESEGRPFEAKRLQERVTYDMEMLRELGHCSGIENYSRYFDGRAAGTRPYCLLDFFPDDFLIVIDESHVSVPQIRAMYGGDRARKTNLVEYGFRLPAAMDNRPLKFEEFESMAKQVIYVSATPADYELMQSEGIVVEQVIRPTGLLDPIIEVRPSHNQIDDLMEETPSSRFSPLSLHEYAFQAIQYADAHPYLARRGVQAPHLVLDTALDALELPLIPTALQHKIPPLAVGHDLTPAIVISQAGHETLPQLPAVAVLQDAHILRHMVPFQNGHDLIAADLHIGTQRLQNLRPGVRREPWPDLVLLLHRSRPPR